MSLLTRLLRPALDGAPALLAAGLMSVAYLLASPGHAHAQAGTNIQVLAMLEDADPRSVVRTSEIARRVAAELKRSMQDEGFRMLDEEMIAVELGWKIVVRRPRTDLIEAMNMANTSTNAALHSRAMVTYSIFAIREQLSFGSRIQVRVEGEIYDALTRQFIGGWEMPRQTFSAPAECNDSCLSEIVGDHAREIAISVGDVLAKQLVALSPGPQAPSYGAVPASNGAAIQGITPGVASTQGTSQGDPRCQGMMTTYSIGFRRFTDLEVLQILNVMTSGPAAGFPCFSSYESIGGTGAVQRFGYVSTASAAKLREWLTLLLADMGLSTDRQVSFLVTGNELMLDKIVPNQPRPTQSGGGLGRFQ
jgi:hypothetical protein